MSNARSQATLKEPQIKERARTMTQTSLLTPLAPFSVRKSNHHWVYLFSHPPSPDMSTSSPSDFLVRAPRVIPWGRSNFQNS